MGEWRFEHIYVDMRSFPFSIKNTKVFKLQKKFVKVLHVKRTVDIYHRNYFVNIRVILHLNDMIKGINGLRELKYWENIKTPKVLLTAGEVFLDPDTLSKFEQLKILNIPQYFAPIFRKTTNLEQLSLYAYLDEGLLISNRKLKTFKIEFIKTYTIDPAIFHNSFTSVENLVIRTGQSIIFNQVHMNLIKIFPNIKTLHIRIAGKLGVDLTPLIKMPHLVDIKIDMLCGKLEFVKIGDRLKTMALYAGFGRFYLKKFQQLIECNKDIRFLKIQGKITNELLKLIVNKLPALEHLYIYMAPYATAYFNKKSMEILSQSNIKRLSVENINKKFRKPILERFYNDAKFYKYRLHVEIEDDKVKVEYENGDFTNFIFRYTPM